MHCHHSTSSDSDSFIGGIRPMSSLTWSKPRRSHASPRPIHRRRFEEHSEQELRNSALNGFGLRMLDTRQAQPPVELRKLAQHLRVPFLDVAAEEVPELTALPVGTAPSDDVRVDQGVKAAVDANHDPEPEQPLNLMPCVLLQQLSEQRLSQTLRTLPAGIVRHRAGGLLH